METRLLGRSGLQVSALSFGTMTFGGVGLTAAMGNTNEVEAERLVGRCIDAGINLFDTADVYSMGRSEEILGVALGKKRQDVLVATKAFAMMGPGPNQLGLSRKHLISACEASLKRLNTDYVDLYQAHSFDALTPLDETLRAFEDLVRSGKVRYIGCSNLGGWQLMKALSVADQLKTDRYVSQQIYYSALDRDAEWDLVPLGLDQGVGMLVYGPLASGLLSGKYRRGVAAPEQARAVLLQVPQDRDRERLYKIVDLLDAIAKERDASISQIAINYVRAKPCVSSVIIGARNEAQLEDNLRSDGWNLTPEEIRRIDEATEQPLPYPYWHQNARSGMRNPYYRDLLVKKPKPIGSKP